MPSVLGYTTDFDASSAERTNHTTFFMSMQDEIRVTVIATGFEEAPTAKQPAQPAQAKKAEPAFDKQQGMFTAASEKAAEKKPEEPAKASGEEDPFDSIFKIFNANN